jgi:short-subunit dehydrogenase
MENDSNRGLAVVTGASSGIGLELARVFAEHGSDLVIAAEDDAISEAAAALRQEGVEVGVAQVDLATRAGVEELHEQVRAAGVAPSAVAINAGVGVSGEFTDTALLDHLRLVELNVVGAVHLAHLVLPAMVDAGDGGLLFTSSVAATMPGPYMSTYNASKAFLLSFAEALRVELKDSGVTVTALLPGPTDTEFFERAGMEDTKLGQTKKDDPAAVARDGFEALMAGKDHVVAGSTKNRLQTAAGQLLPDKVTAAAHAPMSKPGSGKQ